jgi:hypothetical protein
MDDWKQDDPLKSTGPNGPVEQRTDADDAWFVDRLKQHLPDGGDAATGKARHHQAAFDAADLASGAERQIARADRSAVERADQVVGWRAAGLVIAKVVPRWECNF